MKRLAIACAILAIVVVATAWPSRARAGLDGEYFGVTTDFADFKMTVSGVVTGLEIGVPNADVPFPCFTAGTITLTDPIEILNNTIRGGQASSRIQPRDSLAACD